MAKPAVSRATFDREARRLRADDNLTALKKYAFMCFTPYWRQQDLYQMIGEAVMRAVDQWWENEQRPGSCYNKVESAAKAAARDWRGRGGAAVNLTWRGGYSTDQRKFGSQLHDLKATVELAHVMDGEELAADAPEASYDDERDQRDAVRERLAEHGAEFTQEKTRLDKRTQAVEVTIATGAAMLEAGAERASHDGGHADDIRLDPRDDGEAGYGVDGATRGLHTGRLVPSDWWIANERARAVESPADQKWLSALDSAGGLDGWVNKDGNRKRQRAACEARLCRITQRIRERARALLEADKGQLLAGWLAERAQDGLGSRAVGEPGKFRAEAVTAPASAPGLAAWTGTVSAAWPKEPPTRRRVRARSYGPFLVHRGRLEITGHEWARQQRNLKAWRKHVAKLKPGEPLLSLLDMLQGVRTARAIRALQAAGWGERLVTEATHSLIDV